MRSSSCTTGGGSSSAGFQIYFGSPAFFVESSDGLMMDRRQQIIESFAGPFAQLVLAGIASIIAWSFPAWILSETMYKFAVLNYFVVIMNLIPLLELDGYYILADLIQVPDLRARSLAVHPLRPLAQARGRASVSPSGGGSRALRDRWASRSRSSPSTRRTTSGRRCSVVSRAELWAEGLVRRLLLLVLALFIAGRCSAALIALLRAVGRGRCERSARRDPVPAWRRGGGSRQPS